MSNALSVIDVATLARMEQYQVSLLARLLYLLLPLTACDDDPVRVSTDTKFLAGFLYPNDPEAAPERIGLWLGELARAELIRMRDDNATAVLLGRLGQTIARLHRSAQL